MDKTCFVIMPISDNISYPTGHFERVYEFIIKPSCEKAGFTPIRADEVRNTNYIAIDIIRLIIESDMAICDLSSKNPNVFYELGIRQAFNLPVTLIRDSSTDRVFDIQGFRDIEYDKNLRIDLVGRIIENLSETILNTYETKGKDINSLISLLGIHPAKVSKEVEISKDTELILNSLSNLESRLNQIETSITPKTPPSVLGKIDTKWKELSPTEINEIKVSDIVEHPKFGIGTIVKKEGTIHNPIATIAFDVAGSKKVMLNYVKLRKAFAIM